MRIRCFWRWEGKGKSEDGVSAGVCEGGNARPALVPNFGKSGDDQSKKGVLWKP